MRKDNELLKAVYKPPQKPRPMAVRVPILTLWRQRRPAVFEKRVAR